MQVQGGTQTPTVNGDTQCMTSNPLEHMCIQSI